MSILALVVAAAVMFAQGAPTASTIHSRYVQAIGGEAALRAVKTRVTEGNFDNGRGLAARYRIVEEAPNRRVTFIGGDPIESPAGSGRGYDGAAGWDKNFIGTGLRTLEGRELADTARDADLLRPLNLLKDCTSTSVTSTPATNAVVCTSSAGNRVTHHFDQRTGLLVAQDIEGSRGLRIQYLDYREVDGLQLPFGTHIELGGATIQYNATTITHGVPVDRAVFQKPAS